MTEYPSREEILELFDYNPNTGIVVRRKTVSPNAKKGDIAGAVNRYGYVAICVNYKPCIMHIIIWIYMTGEIPSKDIDHINHVRDDNRWTNLRLASRSENQRNRSMPKTNTSGFLGVSWNKVREKWEVYIMANSKRVHLGCFACKLDAVATRVRANKKYGYHNNHGLEEAFHSV